MLPLVRGPYYRLFPERIPGSAGEGAGLQPGDPHYRAFVGPPEDYDLIAGIQFSLLLAAGLRERHRLLDLGCGSLRCGRLAIPYLGLGCYYGIEPNEWLVHEGLRREVGRDLVARRKPRFAYVDDFSAESFGVEFDFVMAQSIFSHTHRDLFVEGLRRVGAALAPEGILLGTYVEGQQLSGTGWLYPACTTFERDDVTAIAAVAGLVARPLDWPHPRQQWFLATRPEAADLGASLAATLRSPRTSD
jgi:SAM-dependent methyltransferase